MIHALIYRLKKELPGVKKKKSEPAALKYEPFFYASNPDLGPYWEKCMWSKVDNLSIPLFHSPPLLCIRAYKHNHMHTNKHISLLTMDFILDGAFKKFHFKY